MKTKEFLGVLLIAFLTVAGLTACTDDDGDWERMKWKTEVKMEKGHVISVPAEGGTYQFTCRNYSIWFDALQENGAYVDIDEYYDVHHIHGEWVTAEADGKVMTVTISPNNSSKQRTAVVGVTAGDVFDSFTFNQAGQSTSRNR